MLKGLSLAKGTILTQRQDEASTYIYIYTFA